MRKGWQKLQLAGLVKIKHGFAFGSEFFAASGPYVLLTPGNFIEEGGFRWMGQKQKFFNGPVDPNYVLDEGDLLIAMTEQAPGLLGSSFFVPESGRYLHNQRLGKAVVVRRDLLDKEFLHHWLNRSRVRQEIFSEASGTKVKHTSPDKLRSLEINLPPLPEQRRIAEILRTWNEAIEKLEALRTAKERRLQGALYGFFGPTRVVGGGMRPKGWTLSSLGDSFVERKDKNTDLTDADVVTVGKYRIGKQTDHFTRSVASKDLSPYWIISPGDFVYDPMSAYYGALGRYNAESDGLVSPAYRVIQLRRDIIDSDFMVQLLRTAHVRFLLEARSSQGNKQGKRRSLQRSAFDSIEFFLPPTDEQKRLAAIAADFEADIASTACEITALQRQKRGLMQKLLTGKWRVKVDEPAEAAE